MACECRCPGCDSALVAKKGSVRLHHFAHLRGGECEHSVETIAHLLAKRILSEQKTLTVPPVYGIPETRAILAPYTDLRFASVVVEKRLNGFVPDIIGSIESGPDLLVEIVVTHPADQEKVQRIVAGGTSAVEVMVPKCDLLSEAVVRWALNTTGGPKRWLFHSEAAGYRQRTFGGEADGRAWRYAYKSNYYGYFPLERVDSAKKS